MEERETSITATIRTLSPLPGEICTQYIRCGKPGCRCAQGQPHGPYHYRVWRDGEKVRKAYIKPADLSTIQARCETYKAIQTHLRQARMERQELSKSIAGQCRTAKRLLRQRQTHSMYNTMLKSSAA